MKAKRFWENVFVQKADGGWRIALDERKLKTPNKNELLLPSEALAKLVAQEWDDVEGVIDPNEMPMTRLANSALERIPIQRPEIEAHLREYLDSDLICYRADQPETLVARQRAWDEWLEWVSKKGIVLNVTAGIMAVEQPKNNQHIAKQWLARLNDFELMAFHEFLTLTGSFVLAMAVCENALEAEQAFRLSRIDDDFQAEQWGEVDEKEEERIAKGRDVLTAKRFFFAVSKV